MNHEQKPSPSKEEGDNREQIEGRKAIVEALRAEHPLDRLFYQKTAKGLGDILDAARAAGVTLIAADKERLDRQSVTGVHQGVIATAAAWAYVTPEDIYARAEQRGEPLFLVVCDGVQDEGNLGAILRTAEAVGVHGVILPKRRSAGLSPRTARASAGAAEHILVARVPGIPAYLRELRKQNVWIYGSAGEASAGAFQTNFKGAGALVLGNEEEGLSRLTKEQCDLLVSLPMWGKISSLNVSCAATLLLYEMKRQMSGETVAASS